MLFGGFFLLFKATMELNEGWKGKTAITPRNAKVRSSGGGDTNCGTGRHLLTRLGDYRLGMVDHLLVMMAAVVIAISLC